MSAGYHYFEVLLENMQCGAQAVGDFLKGTTRKRQCAYQTVSVLDEPYAGPLVKRRRTAVALHATTAVATDHDNTDPAATACTDGQAHTVSQQQLTPPQGWKSPFTFTMGQHSRTVCRLQSFCCPHQNLYIPKSIFEKPFQQRPCASYSGIRAAPKLTPAALVLSRPTAVQHAPADLPFLQRFIMAKQAHRAQPDSQTRTSATSGSDAASLSAPAAENIQRSSGEPAEQGIADVSVAVWEGTPADHGYAQDVIEMLPALPSPTAVGAAPSATAVMGTDASVANVTGPAAEVLHDNVAAANTTAAETVPINVAAGDASSADAGHPDTARTTAAIDRSAAAPLAVDMESVLAQQSETAALERQQNLLRAAAKAQAKASEAADAVAANGTGGCGNNTGGGHRAADNCLPTGPHMASAALTGGYSHVQQASGENVAHGSAEIGKIGIEPSASFPGPVGPAPPSICLLFPLLSFSRGMGCHGQPAFIPSPAAAVAAALVKQKAVAEKARLAQRAAEKAAQKAAQEAAALQRVFGGRVETFDHPTADADMEDEYEQSPPTAEDVLPDADTSHDAGHGYPMHTETPSRHSNIRPEIRAQG
ncbi:TPA: hypothetical protein ACH3X1_001999 [Trebouxia sp. C0004]